MRKQRLHIPLDSFEPSPPQQVCAREGCLEKGEFRAPKSPHHLRDYLWFCLEHVRDYNKSWNFYQGMSPEEIDASRVSDVTWNRPSWPLGAWRTILERTQWCDGLDSFVKETVVRPTLPLEVQKALSVLNLSFPFSLEALKKQYKNLAKCHHPDLHAGDKAAEERLKRVNAAYQTLKKYLQDLPDMQCTPQRW